jgi:hypothetical protein
MQDTRFINDMAQKYGLPGAIIRKLASELEKTAGQSVRFDIEAIGGKGSWQLHETASVGNGKNADLNDAVTELCVEISEKIREDIYDEDEAPTIVSLSRQKVTLDDTIESLAEVLKPGAWWDMRYGAEPEKTGSVSGMKFAYFAQHRRLILRQGLRIRIFDTEKYNVQDVIPGDKPGFFNLIVLTIEGDLRLTDLREVAK